MVLKKKFLFLSLLFPLLSGCDGRCRYYLAGGFVFYGESATRTVENETNSSELDDSKSVDAAKRTNESITRKEEAQEITVYAKVKITPRIQDYILKSEQIRFWRSSPRRKNCKLDYIDCTEKELPKEADDYQDSVYNGFDIFDTKLNSETDYTFCFTYPKDLYTKDDFQIDDIYSSTLEVKEGYGKGSYYFVPVTREEHNAWYESRFGKR